MKVPALTRVFTARKTKCDGAHPACSSCARRSLPCNYVHDSNTNGAQKKGARRASTSRVATATVHQSRSPPTGTHTPLSAPPAPSNVPDGYRHRDDSAHEAEIELKRIVEDPEAGRPLKKMRMDSSPMPSEAT